MTSKIQPVLTFVCTERVNYVDTDGVEFAYDKFIFKDQTDELWEVRGVIYNVASSDYPELTIGTVKVEDEIKTWGELTPEELNLKFNDACSRLYREMW